MNAIILLCNFCEVHGPHSIFCTQTLRDFKIDQIEIDLDADECPGCTSIGSTTGIVSKDSESNANFLSTQKAVIPDVALLVKQAAVRSLSCEVTTNNNNSNTIFFGDPLNGYALTLTFQVQDSHARGLYRLFSVVVLMKEKLFLLNIQPFLVDHLEKLIDDLTMYSNEVHLIEGAKQSERAIRLANGETRRRPPRSLMELTGKKHIYAFIHSHFAWILLMGAQYLTEKVSAFPAFANVWGNHGIREIHLIPSNEEHPDVIQNYIEDSNDSLRSCKDVFGEKFEALCFCVLVGNQVILRGSEARSGTLVRTLRHLLPDSMHKYTHIQNDKYVPPEESRILSIPLSVAVPQPSNNIFRIDIIDKGNNVIITWPGELPNKYPNLLTQVLKAVNEKSISDAVLTIHIRGLIEKWRNNIMALRNITSQRDLRKLRNILEIKPEDSQMESYWSRALERNQI